MPEIQNRTLIKSLQANLNSSGLIYADKKDNLTVSKDILYDVPPEKTPRGVAFDIDSS